MVINTSLARDYLTALLTTTRLFDVSKSSREKDGREMIALRFCSLSQKLYMTSSIKLHFTQAMCHLEDHGRTIERDELFEVSAGGLLKIFNHLADCEHLKLSVSDNFLSVQGATIQPADLLGEREVVIGACTQNPTRYNERLRSIDSPEVYEFDSRDSECVYQGEHSDLRLLRSVYALRQFMSKTKEIPLALVAKDGVLHCETPFTALKLSGELECFGSCVCSLSWDALRVLFNLVELFSSSSQGQAHAIGISKGHLQFQAAGFEARLLTVEDYLGLAPEISNEPASISLSKELLKQRLEMLHITTDKKRDAVTLTFMPDNRLLLKFQDHGKAENELEFSGQLTKETTVCVSRAYLASAIDILDSDSVMIQGIEEKDKFVSVTASSATIIVPKFKRR